MKFRNSFEGKAQLRREQFNKSQSKSQFKGKKSLTKRIIEERADGITADNVARELNNMMCYDKGEELLGQILYHLKFGAMSYPSTFNEEKIMQTITITRKIKADFMAGIINSEQYNELLENIDEQITDKLSDMSHGL